MRILLIYPNSTKLPFKFKGIVEDDTFIEKSLPPLGCFYIISNSKYDIQFIDNRKEKYDNVTLFNLAAGFDMVGFSGTIFEAKQAVNVSRKLMADGIKTVYGGPNATANYRLYKNDFTSIVRGEAENWDWKLTDKIITLPQQINLDVIKFPERIDIDSYNRKDNYTYVEDEPVDLMMSSRGCPYNCTFCASARICNRKYFYRSADDIVAEVRWMQDKYGTKAIYFRDDHFTANLKRLKHICKLMPISWRCAGRADLSEDTVKMMADGGCKAINFGIEATTNDDLEKINKKLTIEKIRETIGYCNKHDIKVLGMFIVGFPWDTAKSIKKRFKDAHNMGIYITSFARLCLFPGSDMYDQVIENNLDQYSFDNIVLSRTQTMNALRLNWLYYGLTKRRKWFIKKYVNSFKESKHC